MKTHEFPTPRARICCNLCGIVALGALAQPQEVFRGMFRGMFRGVSRGMFREESRGMFRGVSRGVFRGVFRLVFCWLIRGFVFGLRSGPPLASSRFGTESDLELKLVERPARFDCGQLWASHGLRQLELKIQISSARGRMPRTT